MESVFAQVHGFHQIYMEDALVVSIYKNFLIYFIRTVIIYLIISGNPGWSFVNDNCLSPVIFLRNASQDACLPYNAVQISVLLQDDFDTYVNMNIGYFLFYLIHNI